jgi:phosphate transport system substrate-binding protein
MSSHRVTSLKGALLIGLFLLGTPVLSDAQLKPSLDEEVPEYSPSKGISGTITVSGSNTMKTILEKWQTKLANLHPGLVMTLQSEGSRSGADLLVSGKAEIVAMSRSMTGEEIQQFTAQLGYPPTAIPVAVDALAVFVHKDNPLEQITLQQLDAIFSSERRRGGTESLDRWGQLGVSGAWGRAPINIHVRDAVSGTSQFFNDLVSLGGTHKNSVIVEPGAASVVAAIMKDRYGIGYSGIGYRTSLVKPLRVAAKEGEPFVEATFDTATNGTYPLRRLLYLYVNQPPKTPPSPLVSELIQFAASQDGQQAVVKAGFYPLPVKDLIGLSMRWSPRVKAAAIEGLERNRN